MRFDEDFLHRLAVGPGMLADRPVVSRPCSTSTMREAT